MEGQRKDAGSSLGWNTHTHITSKALVSIKIRKPDSLIKIDSLGHATHSSEGAKLEAVENGCIHKGNKAAKNVLPS